MDKRYLAIISLFVLISNCLSQTKPKIKSNCDKNGLKNYDKTIAKLVTIANSGRKFPESKGPELQKYCDETATLLRDADQYKTFCTLGLQKQITGVMLYGAKNAVKQLCGKKSKRLDVLLAASPCFNRNDPKVTKCYQKLIDNLMGTQFADDKKKIPHLCCEYFKIFYCFDKELTTAPLCNPTHIEVVGDFIRSMLGDAVNIICGDYSDGSDKCDSLGNPPKKRKNQRRPKSFAIPMLDILSSFPEV